MNLEEENWDYSKQEGLPGHCIVAQVFNDDESFAFVEPDKNPKIASSRAHFISLIPEICRTLNLLVDNLENTGISDVVLGYKEAKELTKKLNYNYEL